MIDARPGRFGLVAGSVPQLPAGLTTSIHVVEVLLLLEGVHAGPESFVLVGNELPLLDEALKWLLHQLFSLFNVVENLPLEDEESPVDPDIRAIDIADSVDRAVLNRGDDVERLGRLHRHETGYLVAATEVVEQSGKMQIGQSVGIVGQEDVLAGQMLLNRFQTLADVGAEAGIHEGNCPVLDVTA